MLGLKLGCLALQVWSVAPQLPPFLFILVLNIFALYKNTYLKHRIQNCDCIVLFGTLKSMVRV